MTLEKVPNIRSVKIPAELMRNVGGIIGRRMPARLKGRRHPLTDFEQALKSDRLEKQVEKEKVVVADDHGQVGLQLTQGQDECSDVQIRSSRRRQGYLHVRS